MATTSRPSVDQLKRALKISEEIQKLEAELATILGNAGETPRVKRAYNKKEKRPSPAPTKNERTMSPEAREKIALAQKARWAKQKKVKKE